MATSNIYLIHKGLAAPEKQVILLQSTQYILISTEFNYRIIYSSIEAFIFWKCFVDINLTTFAAIKKANLKIS